MRKQLLQFGDMMFLDSQKRQYNKVCWPYIGPVIRTGENKVRVVAESVVISEDLDSYQWILKSLSVMEPKSLLSNLRIISSDGQHLMLTNNGTKPLKKPNYYYVTIQPKLKS